MERLLRSFGRSLHLLSCTPRGILESRFYPDLLASFQERFVECEALAIDDLTLDGNLMKKFYKMLTFAIHGKIIWKLIKEWCLESSDPAVTFMWEKQTVRTKVRYLNYTFILVWINISSMCSNES
jgi:hypothetical protein